MKIKFNLFILTIYLISCQSPIENDKQLKIDKTNNNSTSIIEQEQSSSFLDKNKIKLDYIKSIIKNSNTKKYPLSTKFKNYSKSILKLLKDNTNTWMIHNISTPDTTLFKGINLESLEDFQFKFSYNCFTKINKICENQDINLAIVNKGNLLYYPSESTFRDIFLMTMNASEKNNIITINRVEKVSKEIEKIAKEIEKSKKLISGININKFKIAISLKINKNQMVSIPFKFKQIVRSEDDKIFIELEDASSKTKIWIQSQNPSEVSSSLDKLKGSNRVKRSFLNFTGSSFGCLALTTCCLATTGCCVATGCCLCCCCCGKCIIPSDDKE